MSARSRVIVPLLLTLAVAGCGSQTNPTANTHGTPVVRAAGGTAAARTWFSQVSASGTEPSAGKSWQSVGTSALFYGALADTGDVDTTEIIPDSSGAMLLEVRCSAPTDVSVLARGLSAAPPVITTNSAGLPTGATSAPGPRRELRPIRCSGAPAGELGGWQGSELIPDAGRFNGISFVFGITSPAAVQVGFFHR